MSIDAPEPLSVPAIRAVAALDDELRRGMYTFARRARRPITRDEAAAAVGISRKLAAFHLDKLVAAGLLHCHYGDGNGIRRVGRKPKLYEPVEDEVRVTIPVRQYEFLAEVLAGAMLTENPGEPGVAAAIRVAERRGTELGAAERERVRPGRLGAERAMTVAEGLLSRYGFEPARQSPACVRLHNCPFHPLAGRAPQLVCGLNHAFVGGLLDGLRASTVEAVLAPRAGECCVELRPADRPGHSDTRDIPAGPPGDAR